MYILWTAVAVNVILPNRNLSRRSKPQPSSPHGRTRARPMAVEGRPAAIPGTADSGAVWLRRLAPVAAIVVAMVVVYAMGWHRQVSLETLIRHRAVIDDFIDTHYLAAIAVFVGIY